MDGESIKEETRTNEANELSSLSFDGEITPLILESV
jgi:hypothetical protein